MELVIVILMYFVPSIIALCRSHASRWAIVAVNALFGWTIIGWIWAFIWSLGNANRGSAIVINNVVSNAQN